MLLYCVVPLRQLYHQIKSHATTPKTVCFIRNSLGQLHYRGLTNWKIWSKDDDTKSLSVVFSTYQV